LENSELTQAYWELLSINFANNLIFAF